MLAIAVTWVVWVPRALVGIGALESDLVVALGRGWSWGPLVAAFLTAALVRGRAGARVDRRAVPEPRPGDLSGGRWTGGGCRSPSGSLDLGEEVAQVGGDDPAARRTVATAHRVVVADVLGDLEPDDWVGGENCLHPVASGYEVVARSCVRCARSRLTRLFASGLPVNGAVGVVLAAACRYRHPSA